MQIRARELKGNYSNTHKNAAIYLKPHFMFTVTKSNKLYQNCQISLL